MDPEAYEAGLRSFANAGGREFLGLSSFDYEDWTGVDPSPKAKVDIRTSSVAEVRHFGRHLFRQHVTECEPAMLEHLDPDWGKYEVAEERDQLVVVAAWAQTLLIGYAVATIFPNPHYQGLLTCQQDLLFVVEDWRHERIGLHLINRMREQANEHGAHHLLMHAKPGSTLEALLPRLGFDVEEITFREEL